MTTYHVIPLISTKGLLLFYHFLKAQTVLLLSANFPFLAQILMISHRKKITLTFTNTWRLFSLEIITLYVKKYNKKQTFAICCGFCIIGRPFTGLRSQTFENRLKIVSCDHGFKKPMSNTRACLTMPNFISVLNSHFRHFNLLIPYS